MAKKEDCHHTRRKWTHRSEQRAYLVRQGAAAARVGPETVQPPTLGKETGCRARLWACPAFLPQRGVPMLCDQYGRVIDYLRISVTDRCNLRCRYCMPAAGVPLLPCNDILHWEEILTIVRCAVRLGIKRVRLTGGEPLVRKGLLEFVRLLAATPGLEDISLTTNGTLLAEQAAALRAAGVRRVNISLDTLRPKRFTAVTRRPGWPAVWRGLTAALAAGLTPVKLNVVVLRGFNDDELVDFARLTYRWPVHVRFIEYMPLGAPDMAGTDPFMPWREMRRQVETVGTLTPADGADGGPARLFRLPDAPGLVGFITPMSEHFCGHCNRLRLTADGKLRPCLLSDREIDIKSAIRSGDAAAVMACLRQAVLAKPAGHHLTAGTDAALHRGMRQIGG